MTLPARLPLLLAFDLDGTLVHESQHELPPATGAALAQLRALGVKVALITGRDRIPQQVAQAAQPDAVATHNGGTITLGTKVLQAAAFSPEELREVVTHTLPGAKVVAHGADGTLYVDPLDDLPAWMEGRATLPLSEWRSTVGIHKVGFYHSGVVQQAERLRSLHPHLVYTGAQAPYQNYLTVTPAGADKGAALVAVAQALGIPLENTVVFGDTDNDVAMFERAGYAVQSGDLALLRPYADAQVSGPDALAEFLQRLAQQLGSPGGHSSPPQSP
ncbi:HAD-IIB family hydrolase [Deinococcus lacus]|uniref:HAD-IIB family hydrolase n=1 Tax=Deinococcus lacus TaxID=392561 RepID=A0ABW1Y9X1_9DEIO